MEVNGLNRTQIWQVVHRSEIPPNANIIGVRFGLTLKTFGYAGKKAKVRYVAQGHNDRHKLFTCHDTSTLLSSSIRLTLSVAALLGFCLFSHDEIQAYPQRKDKLTRDVYIRPKRKNWKRLECQMNIY